MIGLGALVANSPTKVPIAFVIALVSSALAAPAAAAPQATLPDVEDEVMCPICGTLLELAEAPQAQRQRVFVRRLIAEGRSKEEIKDALVSQYGDEVLAVPGDSGFDLSAYLVPALGFALAAAGLAVGIGRWRRAAGASPPDAEAARASGPSGDDAERLEADLRRYDL